MKVILKKDLVSKKFNVTFKKGIPLNYNPELKAVEHPTTANVWLSVTPKQFDVVESKIKKVLHKMSIMSIPENALLDGVVKLLKENVAFTDNGDTNEEIYQGDIFEQILSEKDLFVEKLQPNTLKKVLDQLEELAELVDTDYVLITQS